MGELDSKKSTRRKKENLRFNGSGCYDPTAYKAITNVIKETNIKANIKAENEKFQEFLHELFDLCDDYGFHLEERIVVRDRKSGKIWR